MSSLTCNQTFHPLSKSIGDQSYPSSSPAWQVCFTKDGKYLACCFGAPDPCIRIWNVESNGAFVYVTTLQGVQERTIRSIAFAPTTLPILAAGSFDGTVCIWEGDQDADFECIAQLEGHENEVKGVCWNSTGSLLATCGRDKTVWLWECYLPGTVGGSEEGEFECLSVLNGHEGDVKSIQFAPSHDQWGDGDEILLSAGYDDSIKCWAEDAGDWYCAATLKAHSSTVWCISLTPGGSRLFSASDDQSLGIFKCYTLKEKKEHYPDEKGSNGLWKCVGKLPNAHSSTIYSVDCAPVKSGHGRVASAGGDNRIQIYREAMGSTSGSPMFSLDTAVTLSCDVHSVCWHPRDGSLLASASDDGCVRVWNYKTS